MREFMFRAGQGSYLISSSSDMLAAKLQPTQDLSKGQISLYPCTVAVFGHLSVTTQSFATKSQGQLGVTGNMN